VKQWEKGRFEVSDSADSNLQKNLSCVNLFTSAGSESTTEGHPLLTHGSAAFPTQKKKIN
jgi:hypothetical protein